MADVPRPPPPLPPVAEPPLLAGATPFVGASPPPPPLPPPPPPTVEPQPALPQRIMTDATPPSLPPAQRKRSRRGSNPLDSLSRIRSGRHMRCRPATGRFCCSYSGYGTSPKNGHPADHAHDDPTHRPREGRHEVDGALDVLQNSSTRVRMPGHFSPIT